MTKAVVPLEDRADKTTRERFAEFLRIYASLNTRLAYATDLGIPLEWVPGYRPPDPTRRRGRARRTQPTGLEWLTWCVRNGFDSFVDIRVEHVERWLAELAEAGYRDATRARMLSAVSAFYRKYLMREGLAEHNPAALVDRAAQHLNRPGGTPSQTTMWSFEACRALLLAACLLADHRRDGPRDRAMVEILVGTGVRAEELVGVNLDDYDRPTPVAAHPCACTAKAPRTVSSHSHHRSPTRSRPTSPSACRPPCPPCPDTPVPPPGNRCSSPAPALGCTSPTSRPSCADCARPSPRTRTHRRRARDGCGTCWPPSGPPSSPSTSHRCATASTPTRPGIPTPRTPKTAAPKPARCKKTSATPP
ncbi:tyrosine-type recombinase/integrase [Saccharopolyspora spinosporotrichia]